MELMKYDKWTAAIEYDDDRAFHGVVVNARDTVHFSGRSVDE